MVILSPTRVVFSGQTVLATAPNFLEVQINVHISA